MTSLRRTTISTLPFNAGHVHSNSSDELEEFAASFVVGSLDEDERTAFAAHIRLCQVCAGLTREFAETADAINETLEPVEATSGLKDRVLSVAAADAQGLSAPESWTKIGVAPDLSQSPSRSLDGHLRQSWLSSIFGARYRAIAAAVAVIAIGGLVAWNIVLQIDSNESTPTPTFASAEFLYDLQGTDAAPQTSGSLYRASDTVGILLLSNLPTIGSDEVYQLWRIKGADALPEDTFLVRGSGPSIVTVNADVADADTIGITIEPMGGSLSPTGDVLLLKQS